MRSILLLSAVLFFSVAFQIDVFANTPPVADAGPDLPRILPGGTAVLQGTATDADGDPIVSWTWTLVLQPSGSVPYLVGEDTAVLVVIADDVGDYVLQLVVSDGVDESAPDSATVTVKANTPPVAIMTAEPTVGPTPLTVSFDGSASYDPDGDDITYGWNLGGSTAEGVSVTYTFYSPGDYTTRLAVTDAVGDRDESDVVIITVLPGIPVEMRTWGRIKALFR